MGEIGEVRDVFVKIGEGLVEWLDVGVVNGVEGERRVDVEWVWSGEDKGEVGLERGFGGFDIIEVVGWEVGREGGLGE